MLISDEVQFLHGLDRKSNRAVATRVIIVPKGTIQIMVRLNTTQCNGSLNLNICISTPRKTVSKERWKGKLDNQSFLNLLERCFKIFEK